MALELYRGDVEPFIGMGDPKSPIDVWFWDADRQGAPLAILAAASLRSSSYTSGSN